MSDAELLDDLIAKLREMDEQLSMAQLETTAQTILASRIRHLTILAHYVLARLERMKSSKDAPTQPGSENHRSV
jgi:hypothetical protein